MYIRTAFVQISDNYLLADLNRYTDFVCIQTLASCLIALIYYLTIFFCFLDILLDFFDILLYFFAKFCLFCVFEFFGCYLWLLNNAPLCLKIFWASSAFALVGWLTPSDGLISLIDGSALFLASLTSLWWVG